MARRINVLILISSLSHGGAEIQALSWAINLKKRGVAVHVGSLFAGPLEVRLRSEEIPYSILTRKPKFLIERPLNFIIGLIRLAQLQRKLLPQNIVAFLYLETLMVATLKALCLIKGKTFFGRRASFGYGGRSKLQDYILRKGYKHANGVFSNSQSNNESSVEDGIEIQKIVLIENFLRSDLPKPRKQSLRIAKGEKVELFNVSNLTEVKNHRLAIEAIRDLQDSGLPYKVTLSISGEGELASELLEYAKRLDVDFTLLGNEDNPWLNIERYSVYVHTSKTEGSSNSLWEAVAMGLPVVTTNCGDASTLKLLARDSVFVAAEESEMIQNLSYVFNSYSSISEAALENARYVRAYRSEEMICRKIKSMLHL